jgi:phenylalanyl-tRNA synthetase beta chain
MKVSVNWVKEYLDFELPAIDELVERIGEQLGAVEEVINLGDKYHGIVIAKVMECQPMADSDHLNVCKIDDGGVVKDVERDANGLVQVVCGAPNVKAGVMVAWLPPGSTVPASFDDKEPFVLSARPLRGTVSNGMLASAKELAIGDNHEGLMLLNAHDAEPGADFATAYQLAGEYIIDIENKMFTHRPDCFGQLGVAREIAGILGHEFHSPTWYQTGQSDVLDITGDELPLEIHNELPQLVPRFMAVAIANVSTGLPSLPWMATYLSRVGIRPINMIVDLTNYMMMLTGQPMHAYDYDKVKALSDGSVAKIIIRNPHADEKIALLSGKEIQPRPEAIMIASDKAAIGLGGVMGGANSEIDDSTQNIILECATFDMYSIRRTSMEHGLFSDAVTRFNKGQSPLQNDRILDGTVRRVLQYTDQAAHIESAFIDNNNLESSVVDRQALFPVVTVSAAFVNERLGLNLSGAEMKTLLDNVEFTVSLENDSLVVQAPFWRTDIELREDIVEEVGRLYGFDKLPLELPRRDVTPTDKNSGFELKAKIRESLKNAGANEILTYSFVHGKLLENVTQNKEQAFKVSNALSPDLQYYRLHALPSLLDKVHGNIKAGYDEFALFELNKGHNLLHKDDDNGVPTEIEFLDFVYASKNKRAGSPFYMARRYLDALGKDFGLTFIYSAIPEDPKKPVADPYDYKRSAFVSTSNGDFLGMVGELKASVLKALKLPAQTAVFTIGPDQLSDAIAKAANPYKALPKFPKVQQDICLKVAYDLGYQELHDFVADEVERSKPENSLVSLAPVDIYQRDDDQTHKQITFRLTVASYEKTLTDQEVSKLLDAVAEAAASKYSAERI